MRDFAEQIFKNLESNGFPHKRVSLPTEKMYEIADNKGVSLNAALDLLKSEHAVDYSIGDDKIIFSQSIDNTEENDPFAGMDQAQMMQKAQEMMSQMDPAELKRMQDMFMNMSEQEKTELMQKGKDLGII